MYDEDLEPQSNVIEVHVAQLRRKLDPNDELQPIETVRGFVQQAAWSMACGAREEIPAVLLSWLRQGREHLQ